MSLYDRLRTLAERMLTEYKTGETSKLVVTRVPAFNEWDMDTFDAVTESFDCYVKGVSSKIADGERILLSDRVVIVVGGFELTASDNITIDGRGVEVVTFESIPAAGEPVLRKLVVRG